MSVAEIFAELSAMGVRAICPAPGKVKLVADAGSVPARAVDIARDHKPALVEHFATAATRCPHCGGCNLVDDPVGVACTDCDHLAFIDTDAAIVRVDTPSTFDDIDPNDVPLCDRCGRLADVLTLADRWCCSHCDPAADARKRRTEALLKAADRIKRRRR